MELDQQKITEIFNKVYQLTLDKKLEWQATDTNHKTFFAYIGQYTIYIQGLDLSYNFLVRRKEGNIDLGKLTTTFLTTSELQKKMESLFSKVKRTVLKIDEGLDDLLKTLGEI